MPSQKKQKSKKILSYKSFHEYKFYYLILLPGLIYYAIFRYVPLLGNIVAFKRLSPFSDISAMIEGKWIGLQNFERFLNSYYFFNILQNTFILAGIRLILETFLPIALALMINEIRNKYFQKVVTTIYYMPFFISTVVLAGLVVNLFEPKILS